MREDAAPCLVADPYLLDTEGLVQGERPGALFRFGEPLDQVDLAANRPAQIPPARQGADGGEWRQAPR